MKSRLYTIQDTVMKISEAISKMLQVDVEIIDADHNRIAGTGIFKDKINENNENDGHGYRYTLTTGKKLIIDNPGEHPECAECKNRDNCSSVLEITMPIKVDDKLEGAAGLICTDEKKKQYLMENMDATIFFVEQMSALISGKIKERELLQKHLNISHVMEFIMEGMEKGVIILSSKNKITMMNESAKEQLGLTNNDLGEYINIIVTGDTITGEKEFRTVIRNDTHTVIGEYEVIEGGDEAYSKVLKFDSIKKYRNQMYNMVQQVLPHDINSIIGNSENTKKLRKEIKEAADCNSTVLITGETGTGKELVGTAIWKESIRANEPFVYFNCNGMPEELIESMLFGIVYPKKVNNKRSGKIGKFEMANEGVLFLDEIDAMPLYIQIKLERAIRDHHICRKGSSQKVPVNVRIISATKENLYELVQQGKFRASLYYLLSVLNIRISPLRDRRDDIEDLIYYYIQVYTKKYHTYFKRIDPETLMILKNHAWMGNVRELETLSLIHI